MSSKLCYFFPHEDADGPANMARDEALLDLVSADPSAATFRTYGWSTPTLSMGYFQAISEAQIDSRWQDAPTVRRPTGGGAIWHEHELTYAFAVPRDHPLAARTDDLYRAVHLAIATILNGFGAKALRRGDAPVPQKPGRPFLCFADSHPDDIVIGPHKVVGSAQRRRRGAVLQHGSVLLLPSERTPALTGAAELAPVPSDPSAWANLLRDAVPGALGFRTEVAAWPEPVLRRAGVLERDVYRNAAWTARR